MEMIGGCAMKDLIRRFAVLAAMAGLLSGCNTMAGVGKDVEKLGAKIEQKAKK
jgi:predicted small secreted protein